MAPAIMANLAFVALLFTAAASDSSPPAYTNYTVGGSGSVGWLFNPNTNTSSINYSKWAANQTFNLGDFLIFNTTTNQTVVQTYNETSYKSCELDDSSFVYTGGNEIGKALTLAVPLTIEGPNYYFSDVDDGVQCAQGMAFEIVVKHGRGLPPSLNQPPPPLYVEPPSSDSAPSPPSTVSTNQQETFYNGDLRSGANMCMGVSVLILLGFLLIQ